LILTVLQPNYLPSVRWCARARAADHVVWGETFQYSRRSPVSRTAIKSAGESIRLSVPVKTAGRRAMMIRDAVIDNGRCWRRTHWRAIENNYAKSPYFLCYADELKTAYTRNWETLESLLNWSALFLLKQCGTGINMIKSRSLPGIKERTERVVAWLAACSCSTYLLTPEELGLIDGYRIRSAGYKLALFRWQSVDYHQADGPFISGLSALDLIMNEGELSGRVVEKGIKTEILV